MAALAVTAPLTVPAGADVEKITCRKATELSGAGVWQSFPKPSFESLAGVDIDLLNLKQEVAAMAVHPANSKVVAVTNGNAVYVSRNGGCDWTLSLRLEVADTTIVGGLPSGETTRIRGLYITRAGTFLAIAEDLETDFTVGRPYVLRSTTGNIGTWQAANTGIPPLGKPLVMRGHRTNANVLYLTLAGARDEVCPATSPVTGECATPSEQGRRLGLMYASTDGGATWQSRTDPGDLNSVAEIKHFSVDDNDGAGNTVWVVANGQLRVSNDGGRSYATPQGIDQSDFQFTAVESLANDGSSRQIEVVAFSADSQMLRLHRTEGWIRSRLPFQAVDTVAQRPEGDIAVTTLPSQGTVQVWRIYPQDFQDFEDNVSIGGKILVKTYGWEGITPPLYLRTSGAITAADSPGPVDGTFYVRDTAQVLRFLRSRLVRTPPLSPPYTVGPPPFPKGRIAPSTLEVDLPLGKTTTVDYTLTLPPAPTPIDLYLLVDNSGSMDPTIDDLKENLGNVAQALHDANVDIAIGVGQINVQPDRQGLPIDDPRTENVDESKPRPIYQRLLPVSPVTPALAAALDRLDGNGGSGEEPQLEALYQAIEGTGLDLLGFDGSLTGYNIPPGHKAEFREALDPVKIIVHATDEPFSTTIRGTNAHNDPAVVARVLKQAGVRQIGLSQGMDDAAKDLEYMARATGAIAPAGGTDCDGDGRIGADDVKGGEPLVCGQSDGLNTTLVNLIQSFHDPATITLHPNNAPTMVKVSRADFAIDAKQSTKVRFAVTYSCVGLEPGQYVNEIDAALRGYTIATTVANINCDGKTNPAPLQQPVVEPFGNPPPPQPQPLAPAPIPLNPVAQPQTQIQTQVNPQAGMAEQEDEQFQLATAENELGREQDEVAMAGLPYEDSPAVVLGLGVAMASAAGVALRRRSRTASAKVTVRR